MGGYLSSSIHFPTIYLFDVGERDGKHYEADYVKYFRVLN